MSSKDFENLENTFFQCLNEINFKPRKKIQLKECMFDEDSLQLLRAFANLKSENVLTPDEISEYSKLSQSELSYYEQVVQQRKNLPDKAVQKRKYKYLSTQKDHIMSQINFLEKRQKNLMSAADSLLQEKNQFEEVLKKSKKQLEAYSFHKIPQAERMLATNLQQFESSAANLRKQIGDPSSNILPSPILEVLHAYFEDELLLRNYIKLFMEKNFKVNNDFEIEDALESLSKEFLKEAIILSESLKSTSFRHLKLTCENIVEQNENEIYDEGTILQKVSEIPFLDLRRKKSDLSQVLSCMQEKENFIKRELSDVLALNIDQRITRVALAFSDELVNWYNEQQAKIQLPLQASIEQKSRYELLFSVLDCSRQDLMEIGRIVHTLCTHCADEKLKGDQRQVHYEEELNKIVPENASSFLINLHNILSFDGYTLFTGIKNKPPNTNEALLVQIQSKIKDLLLKRDQLQDQRENRKFVVESRETKQAKLEECISSSAGSSNANAIISRLDLKGQEIRSDFRANKNVIDEYEKVLESRRPYRVARSLFSNYFLDYEHFRKQMSVILHTYEMYQKSVK